MQPLDHGDVRDNAIWGNCFEQHLQGVTLSSHLQTLCIDGSISPETARCHTWSAYFQIMSCWPRFGPKASSRHIATQPAVIDSWARHCPDLEGLRVVKQPTDNSASAASFNFQPESVRCYAADLSGDIEFCLRIKLVSGKTCRHQIVLRCRPTEHSADNAVW